jgi:hypothetical protein
MNSLTWNEGFSIRKQLSGMVENSWASPSKTAVTFNRKGIILYRVPEFLSSRLNWAPPPTPSPASVSPTWDVGGDTPGGRGRGDPIQRLDRNSGTLYRMIPLRLKPCITWTRKKVRKMAEKVTISAHFGWNGEGVVGGGQCLTYGEGRCPPLSCPPPPPPPPPKKRKNKNGQKKKEGGPKGGGGAQSTL